MLKKKEKIKVESKAFHKKHITQKKKLLFLISYKDYVNWIQYRYEVYSNALKSF